MEGKIDALIEVQNEGEDGSVIEKIIAKNIKEAIKCSKFWNLDLDTIYSILDKSTSLSVDDAEFIVGKLYQIYGEISTSIIFHIKCDCSSKEDILKILGNHANAPIIKRLKELEDQELIAENLDLRKQNEILSDKLNELNGTPSNELEIDLERTVEVYRNKIDEINKKIVALNETYEQEMQTLKDQNNDARQKIEKIKIELQNDSNESKRIQNWLPSPQREPVFQMFRCTACISDKPINHYFCQCNTCFPGKDVDICVACASRCHYGHRLTLIKMKTGICSCRDRNDYCRCRCTYVETGDNYVNQMAYKCLTCFDEDSSNSICEACAANCHRGHNLEVVSSKSFCDCGKDHGHCLCYPVGIPVNPKVSNLNRKKLKKIPL